MSSSEDITKKIKAVLEELRSGLQADGGDVEFVGWDEKSGTVRVRLMGMCVGCPMAQITLNDGILKSLHEKIPEVKHIAND